VTEVQMPMLGLTMSEGVIHHWLKAEGEPVRKGEPLLEIETDKTTMEVEAPAGGVLLKILVESEQIVPVGKVVGIIGDPAQPAERPTPRRGAAISPRARALAGKHGIDWRQVDGTGADGLITESDIQVRIAATSVPGTSAATFEVKPLTFTRQIIAERLSKSLRECVHIYLTVAVNMTEARRARGSHYSYNDFFIKSLAVSLAEFPVMNSSLIEGRLQLHPPVDIGIAVAADDGTLVVPVLRGVESKTLDQIATERRALVARARARQITPEEMSGGTFTLTNLGTYGVEQFTAIINPPQIGILAVGAISDELRYVNQEVTPVPVVRLTLGVDHRVVDGAQAAQFLGLIRGLLENAARLLRSSFDSGPQVLPQS
jgi:pyruvate dehydrogenase E2 component (dihydrolipoyllysine-residue acetyltransferase)